MAKTLKSISFTTLLLLVLFISAEIPKSEATCKRFLGEGIVSSYPCKENECEAQCSEHYPESCKGECEEHDHDEHHDHVENHDHEEHCHCYGREY